MASKSDLLKEAQAAGLAPEDATVDEFTAAQLEALLGRGDRPAWDGSASSDSELVAPDGHVNLSKEDIYTRG
jgi:hypothetical protein